MASTYEPIASQTLGTATATVSFTSIAADWTDLVVSIQARGSNTNVGNTDFDMRFNGDTGTNYSRTWLYEDGVARSLRAANQGLLTPLYPPSSQATANVFSADLMHIFSYANTNVYKTVLASGSTPTSYTIRSVGLWRSTAAINSIVFIARNTTFVSGSTFSLYGIKAA